MPSLWLWETGNVLVQAEQRGRISAAAIRTFVGLLENLPISIDQPNVAASWHDTLALALRRSLPQASRDKALQRAAQLEGVPVLPS